MRQQVASRFEDSVVVVGALKFRFPTAIQNHGQILWWDAVKESGEVFPPHLKCIFAKLGLGRSVELKAKASSLEAQFVEFREEAEILPKLSEIFEIKLQGQTSVPVLSKSTTTVSLPVSLPVKRRSNAVSDSAYPQIVVIPVAKTRPKKDQPRKYFDEKRLLALGHSLLHKQYVPVIVTCAFGDPDCHYQIEDGERRWRACQLVGKQNLEAIIVRNTSEAESFKRSAICNLGREGHQPMEIAETLDRIRREDPSMTIKKLADTLANSEGWVVFHLSLLKLKKSVRELLNPGLPEKERLNSTTAHEISKLPEEHQLSAAKHILEHGLGLDQTRHYVRHLMVKVGGNTTSGRKRGPRDDYVILRTFLRRNEEGLDRLLDLPGELTLESLFRYRSSYDAEGALESIDRIIEKFTKARAQIEASQLPTKGSGSKVLALASKE